MYMYSSTTPVPESVELQNGCLSCLCRRCSVMCVTVTLGVTFLGVIPFMGTMKPGNDPGIVSVMSELEQRKLLLRAKVHCYLKMKAAENATKEELRRREKNCPVVWDDILCWNEASPNTLQSQTCPDYVNRFNKNENATRFCTENGTWLYRQEVNDTWTNFSACSKSPFDRQFHAAVGQKLRLISTTGYSVSLAALIVAVIIMLCCRRLHCKSNTLHINLFIAFILRASISFLKDGLFVGGLGLSDDVRETDDGFMEFVEKGTHWQCKLLFCLFNYTIIATMMWIFVEGLYLHMLIYRTLATERNGVKFYIVLGWILPLPFLIAWSIVKALLENKYCWNLQLKAEYFWILKGPGVAVVLINFFFFLDIFRILFIRARANQRHLGKAKYRKLAKFILVLLPLFGVMYILFFVAFPTEFKTDQYNVAYLYLEMGYNSFQGFILALLFCFLNEEVHGELRRMWKRHKSRRGDTLIFSRSFGASSWKKSSNQSKNSPATDRRQVRQLRKFGSTSSNEADHSDELLKRALKARAMKFLVRQDTVEENSVATETSASPVNGKLTTDRNANTSTESL